MAILFSKGLLHVETSNGGWADVRMFDARTLVDSSFTTLRSWYLINASMLPALLLERQTVHICHRWTLDIEPVEGEVAELREGRSGEDYLA